MSIVSFLGVLVPKSRIKGLPELFKQQSAMGGKRSDYSVMLKTISSTEIVFILLGVYL